MDLALTVLVVRPDSTASCTNIPPWAVAGGEGAVEGVGAGPGIAFKVGAGFSPRERISVSGSLVGSGSPHTLKIHHCRGLPVFPCPFPMSDWILIDKHHIPFWWRGGVRHVGGPLCRGTESNSKKVSEKNENKQKINSGENCWMCGNTSCWVRLKGLSGSWSGQLWKWWGGMVKVGREVVLLRMGFRNRFILQHVPTPWGTESTMMGASPYYNTVVRGSKKCRDTIVHHIRLYQ
jgi:hypothetical protein